MSFFLCCAGLVAVVVFVSWIVELIYNLTEAKKNDWRFNVRAEDIEELKRIFERG
jgi:hypothetical protein